ncbi:MAG: glycoside hydrolase family 31 protein [Bacteroidales bacterium]|nr:glycoside hydrolase family 31 protein [Bacteroidales bacterium]
MKISTILIISIILLVPGISYSQSSFLAEDGIAVFYPTEFDSTQTLPSIIIEKELLPREALPSSWEIIPDFSVNEDKSLVEISYGPDVDLYGTGEVTGSLRRNDTEIELWNTDNYGYRKAQGKRLYQSHPWIMGVRKDGSAFGIIADNTWKQSFNLKNPITISSDGPPFRVIIIERETPQELLKTLAELTGKIEMPPIWALGYQQCRFSYFPDTKVREVAYEFRKRKIPCDVIWVDIDYMDNFKVFTFHPERFPDPDGLNHYLHSLNIKSVWMIDPGVKKEDGYIVYEEGTAGDHWVYTNNNEVFTGNVWPGECVFPDFTIPETRQWWGSLYRGFIQTGIDGVWNDMNEPSVFNRQGGTMPETNWHRGGGLLQPGPHLRYHNIYGLLMVKASRDGILKANPGKRPFVLSRSNFLGGQKYAATWTGDNASTWEHFKMATPMVLNLGLSGQPFTGPDLGGYRGSPDTSLFANWIAVGAFYPFCRSHTEKGTGAQEPWAFGEEVENVSRKALERRYRLMPYLYTLFWEASQTGLPVMRPVFFADITNLTLRSEDEAFMWGDDLLIIPQWAENPGLPGGIWRTISLLDADAENDGYQPELRQRGGSIIPLGSLIQSTDEFKTDSTTLFVCLDENNKAGGTLYVDEGDGFDYRNGDFEVLTFNAKKIGKKKVIVRCKSAGTSQTKDQRYYQIGLVSDTGIFYSDWEDSNTIKVKF